MSRAFVLGNDTYLLNGNSPINGYGFTLHGLIYTTSNSTIQTIIGEGLSSDSGANSNIELRLQGPEIGDPLEFQVATTTSTRTSNAYNVDQWNYCTAWAASETSRKVVLNGDFPNAGIGTANSEAWTNNADEMTISSIPGYYKPAYIVSGSVAEVAVWQSTLTDAEIAILHLGFSPLFVRPQSLVAYWQLVGRTSPEIDRVGGYDMTVTNGPIAAAHPPVMYPVSPQIFRAFHPGIAALNLNHSPGNLAAWKTGVRIVSP